jgi:hypothetical protein
MTTMKCSPLRCVRFVPLACAFTLAGCGGGHDAAPDPLSGTLEAGKAMGVHFETSTQSGATDANGTFTYLPGETVTFSIGGLQLGSAPGAARISLFTLAGMTPPTTELGLRRELERAGRLATPLTRTMNISRLLIALDTDGNPDNGIDLTGRVSELASKHIDLGLGLFACAARIDRLAPNLTRNIPMSRALMHAYQSANLKVAAHAPTRYEDSFGPGVQRSTTVTYFASGAISEELNESGPLILGGVSRITYAFDGMGRFLSVVAETLDGPFQSSIPTIFRASNTYDSRGNLVGEVTEQALTGGSLVRRTAVSAMADTWGHLSPSTDSEDSNGDGIVDVVYTTLRSFDERGNPASTTYLTDTNADGTVDSSHWFTDKFDANDRVQTELYTADSNGDGVIDLRSSTAYERDSPSSLVRTVLVDWENDGVIDERDITRWVYDAAGNNVLINEHRDRGTDGTTFSSSQDRMSYDDDRRLLSRVATTDYEADGLIDQTDQTTYMYDGIGNLLKASLDYDLAFQAVPNHQELDFEYGVSGEPTATRTRVDFDGDGVFESVSTSQITSQEVSDGVGIIAHQYFEGARDYVDGRLIVGSVSYFAAQAAPRRAF